MAKQKVLWIGDAVAHTGFSRVTENVCDHLHASGEWDVTVWGWNYYGTPEENTWTRPYPCIPTQNQIDESKIKATLEEIKPDVIGIIQDAWVVSEWAETFRSKGVPAICYCPVDMPNLPNGNIKKLNQFSGVAAYTMFGMQEMAKSGLDMTDTKRRHVIPHGIDINQFYPVPKHAARAQMQNLAPTDFVVGLVGRNQPRKRLDLAFRYFADFARDKPDNVKLYYHGALVDMGWHLKALAKLFGIEKRFVYTNDTLTAAKGLPMEFLRNVYSSFDVQISTTFGEGWGLCHHEGMACGVPQIVPEWSALKEWAAGGVHYVPCTDYQVMVHLNTIGGIPNKDCFISALDKFYDDSEYRSFMGTKALRLATNPQYNWSIIAKMFSAAFKQAMKEPYQATVEVAEEPNDSQPAQQG